MYTVHVIDAAGRQHYFGSNVMGLACAHYLRAMLAGPVEAILLGPDGEILDRTSCVEDDAAERHTLRCCWSWYPGCQEHQVLPLVDAILAATRPLTCSLLRDRPPVPQRLPAQLELVR